MTIQLGATIEHGFDEPLGLMSDCHRRIERFLGVLLTVAAECGGEPLALPHREALAQALRYFQSAGPLHNADEEESLFPRLREAGGGEVERALKTVESLEADHRGAEQAHSEVDRLGSQWLVDGELDERERQRLEQILSDLQAVYRRHIALEDQQIFPLAARKLSPDAIRQIGREMAARRGLDLDNLAAVHRCAAKRIADTAGAQQAVG